MLGGYDLIYVGGEAKSHCVTWTLRQMMDYFRKSPDIIGRMRFLTDCTSPVIIPGVIGGVTGAYVLSNIDGAVIKPYIQAYLAAIGLYLVWRGFHLPPKQKDPKWVAPLGLTGGFMDATGGGGWGPIVTSNLLLQGSSPRHTIGTVNTVEFFLTLSISLTFLIHLGWQAFTTYTLGLLIGGVLAAPVGAMLARHIPPRLLFTAVGFILTLTSIVGLAKYLGYIG